MSELWTKIRKTFEKNSKSIKSVVLIVEGLLIFLGAYIFSQAQTKDHSVFWGEYFILITLAVSVVYLICGSYDVWQGWHKSAGKQSGGESTEVGFWTVSPEPAPGLERYFTSLKNPSLLKDLELRRIVKGTHSGDLQALGNSALILRLLKLYESPSAKLQTLDKMELVEVLVDAGTLPIDRVLEEQLVNGTKGLVLEILKGLQKSNRSIEDVVRLSRLVSNDKISV